MLHSAAKGGNWDIIRELLDLGCDHSLQTKFGCTALHHAAQGGAYQVAENLLNLGCNIRVQDRDGNMPWHAAAEGGNLKVLELFLDKGERKIFYTIIGRLLYTNRIINNCSLLTLGMPHVHKFDFVG